MKSLGDVVGVDLRALDGKPLGQRPTPVCPGARMRVTRKDYDAMRQAGERFRHEDQTRKNIPVDGYGDARVYCTNLVEIGEKGCTGEPIEYGLCASCSRTEQDNRLTLREREKARSGNVR
jgi:hypothetical protein